MDWTTRSGMRSAAMGFAPFGEMPVTRRAPYVALALWTGERLNPFHSRGPAGTVSMAHAPHSWSEDKHREHWDKTVEAVDALSKDPPEDTKELREISFCLRAEAVARAFGE